MQLDIPAGDFAGYIFDLDGTLIDSMPIHYVAWDAAMRRAGLAEPLSEDLFYSLGGVPTRRVAELIGQHYGLKVDVEQVFHAKEAFFVEKLAAVKVIEPVAAVAFSGFAVVVAAVAAAFTSPFSSFSGPTASMICFR